MLYSAVVPAGGIEMQARREESTLPPAFLQTIEQTAFSEWLRESPSVFGFWFVLTFHALGIGLLVGASSVIGLRVLGVAPGLPLATLKRFYPIVWAGFWIQVVSGVLLMIAYPTKSLMTPAFYVKIAFIAAAMVVMVRLRKGLPSTLGGATTLPQVRVLASWTLILWFGAITAGRMIGYTAKYIVFP